jgi:hypothetical protein
MSQPTSLDEWLPWLNQVIALDQALALLLLARLLNDDCPKQRSVTRVFDQGKRAQAFQYVGVDTERQRQRALISAPGPVLIQVGVTPSGDGRSGSTSGRIRARRRGPESMRRPEPRPPRPRT